MHHCYPQTLQHRYESRLRRFRSQRGPSHLYCKSTKASSIQAHWLMIFAQYRSPKVPKSCTELRGRALTSLNSECLNRKIFWFAGKSLTASRRKLTSLSTNMVKRWNKKRQLAPSKKLVSKSRHCSSSLTKFQWTLSPRLRPRRFTSSVSHDCFFYLFDTITNHCVCHFN